MQVGALEIKLFTDIARLQSDMNKANQTVDRAMGNIEKSVNVAKRALGGLFAGVGIATIANTIDAYKRFDAQLQLATKSASEYAQAYSNVVRISRISQSDIGAVGVLYARLNNNLREFGTTQKEISTITEAVSLSLRVSNATVQETNSVMLQLSQSFGSGKINGQEFLAVSEGAPIIMRQLAKSLKTTYGELKNMSTEGKLTSEVLKTALSDPAYLAGLREQVKLVGTISSALQVAKNSWIQYIGEADKGQGTSKLLSQGILLLADNINNLVTVALGALVVKLGQVGAATMANLLAQKAAIAVDSLKLASDRKILLSQVVLREAQLASIVATNASSLAIGNNAALTTRAAIADTALTAAKTKLAAATVTSGVAARAFGSAIAFLGGPIGVAIIAFGALGYAISKAFDQQKLEKYGKAIDGIRERAAVLAEKHKAGISIDNDYSDDILHIKELQKARDGLFSKLKAGEAATSFKPSLEARTTTALEYVQAIKDIKNAEKDLGLKIEQDNMVKAPKSTRALSDSVKLLSAQIKEQQDIMIAAKKDLDAYVSSNGKAGISQSDYTRVVQDAKKVIEDLTGATKANNAALKEQSESYKEGLKGIQETIDLEMLLANEVGEAFAKSLSDKAEAEKQYSDALGKSLENSYKIAETEQQRVDDVQRQIDVFGLSEEAITALEAAKLNDAAATYTQQVAEMERNGVAPETIAYVYAEIDALKLLAKAKEQFGKKTTELNGMKEVRRAQEEMEKEAKRSNEEIGKSLTDALLRGFESGKGFAKNFKDTLINMFKTLVLRPAIQFLVDSSGITKALSGIGSAFSGGGTAGGSSGAGTTGGFLSGIKDALTRGNNSIVSSIGSLGQSISAFGSTGTGFIKDMASRLGSFTTLNAGLISKALPYAGAIVQLLKGDVKGAAFTAIGAAIGGPIGGAIGGLVGSFFGGKKKVPRFSTQRAGQYEDGVFTGTSAGQTYKPLGAEVQIDGLSEAFSRSLGGFLKSFGLNDSVSTIASLLKKRKASYGNFAATFDGRSVTGGTTGKAKNVQDTFQRLIEQVLGTTLAQAIQKSKVSDGIKKFFNGLTKKEDVADAINTLVDLNRQLGDLPKVFNAIRNAIDTTRYKTSIADLKAQFAAIGTYTSLFYTADEQFATFTKQITTQLGVLDTPLLNSRDEYRKLVDGITVVDKKTSGLFNGLVALAPAMDAYFKQLEAQKAATDALVMSMASLRTEDLFKTLFDFKRYTGVADNYGSDFANNYVDNLPSFSSGTNMLPNDMIAQVHAGERIVPAADNQAIIQALNGGTDLKQLIRDLIIEVRSGNISMVQAAQKTAKVMQRIDDEGVMINETNNAGVRTVLNTRVVA